MYFLNVDKIKLINFRNYENIDLDLNKNVNIFIGKNAQGKTNLLEAIHMCAMGKSFRTNRDKEIIKFSKNAAYIGVDISFGNHKKFIEIKLESDRPKTIRINKTELKSHKDLDSGLNIVLFSPEDLRMVKDGPQERRNFLDKGISQTKPVYNYNINRYKKLLFQRNNLLRTGKFRKNIGDLLDVFDIQISKIGTSIIIERSQYIDLLSRYSKEIHGKITEGLEELILKYSTNIPILEDRKEMEKAYIDLMKKNIKRDIEYGSTEIGPHRDDILMYIDDREVKVFGSQGQQRTVVLSLILSQVELIKSDRGMYPVLLLDDVFSELDIDRRKYLSTLFCNIQTFITLTNSENLKSIDGFNRSIFYIEDGKLIDKE